MSFPRMNLEFLRSPVAAVGRRWRPFQATRGSRKTHAFEHTPRTGNKEHFKRSRAEVITTLCVL
jgi:hypothetical protein